MNGILEIPLYCEFTDSKYFEIVIKDEQNGLIDEVVSILGNTSLNDIEHDILINSSLYDNNPGYDKFFDGFIDSNGNPYTLEQLGQHIITGDMTFYVNWSLKYKLKYDDGVNEFYIPGSLVTLKEDSEHIEYVKDSSDTYIAVHEFNYWTIAGNKIESYIIPNQIGGEIEVNGHYVENSNLKYYKVNIKANSSVVTITTADGKDSILLNTDGVLYSSSTSTCYVKVGTIINIKVVANDAAIGHYDITKVSITGFDDEKFSSCKTSYEKKQVTISNSISITISTKYTLKHW